MYRHNEQTNINISYITVSLGFFLSFSSVLFFVLVSF